MCILVLFIKNYTLKEAHSFS